MKQSSKPKQPNFVGQNPDHPIKLSFSLGGIDYYEFDEDVFFLPFQRGLAAVAHTKIFQCGVDRDYMLWHVGEFEKIFKDAKQFDLGRMAVLNAQLKERLQFIFNEDLVYERAAIVYFDETENPYKYSEAYGRKKIAFWKKNEAVESFFLRQPIKKLIPFLKEQDENILNYLQVAQKIKEKHTNDLLLLKSSNPSIMTNPTS